VASHAPPRGLLPPRAEESKEVIAGMVMFGYLMARWPTELG